jgi:hypothetical protein
MEYLLKERDLDNSSKLNQVRAKGIQPVENTVIKKELLTIYPGSVADGELMKSVMMMSENQLSQSSPCGSISGTEG